MRNKDMEFNIEEWKKLTEKERINIVNNYWNPFEPSIGEKTKINIINSFLNETKIPSLQTGIKCFGWNVYMLYVVVENSRIRVPSKYLGLSINKGIIVNENNDNKILIKFNYGGKFELDLKKKILIK